MKKKWFNNYPKGIKKTIDLAEYPSISAVFDDVVKKYGDRPAYHHMGKTLTYYQTNKQVNSLASYLKHHLRIERGQRVAIMMPNTLQYPIAVFGILKAELAVVNVNPLYTPRELEHQLKDSGATAIIVMENFANTLEKVLPQTEIKHIMISSIGDFLGLKGLVVNLGLRHLKRMVPTFRIPHSTKLTDALKQGQSLPEVKPMLTLDDVAFLQYTSATTGVAKGAVLTHRNIVANMLQVSEWIHNQVEMGKEIVLTALPLYHIFALTANLMTFTFYGGLNILITNPKDMDDLIREIGRHKITILIGVNTLFNGMLHHANFKNLDFSSWRFALGGGMAIQKVVAERWQKITQTPLIEAYGLTETSPGVCINPLNEFNRLGTIGLPLPSTAISIRNSEGDEVRAGETGELWVKGPQVMREYWKQPDETAKVFDEKQFFSTGDLAAISPDGFIKLVDRKKDMILVSGFNVYPNEIEDVMATHQDVLEVACIGVPDIKTGEALKLYIIPKNEEPPVAELIAFARQFLTPYKVPKLIEFRSELPKNNVGKILRRDLRQDTNSSKENIL